MAALAGGELELAKEYLSGFTLTIWLADRNPDYEITSPTRLNRALRPEDLVMKPADLNPVLSGR